MTQHCEPPYRAVGYSYTYRIYISSYRRVSRYTPPLLGVSQNYVEGGGVRGGAWGGGYRKSMLPSPLYGAIGVYSSYAVANHG